MPEEFHDESKLTLPKHCVVPIEARLDKNLSYGAQIFLGELHVLANKFGYCFAEDDQLAEMKECAVRTIQRWLKELEDGGHIWRCTENVLVTENGKPVWKKKRKVYVDSQIKVQARKKESKKDCGTAKNGECREHAKNGGSIEPAKNGAYKYRTNRNTECLSTELEFCSSVDGNLSNNAYDDPLPKDPGRDVKSELHRVGCDRNFIKEMIRRFSPERILNGLTYAIQQRERKNIKNFFGYLRSSIESGRVWTFTEY